MGPVRIHRIVSSIRVVSVKGESICFPKLLINTELRICNFFAVLCAISILKMLYRAVLRFGKKSDWFICKDMSEMSAGMNPLF